MLRRVFTTAAAIVLFALPASAQLRIQPFVTGLSSPVAFVQDPGDSTTQYVIQQNGHIRVVKSGVVQPTDFLDLSASVSVGGERGLLGLAFEPGDATDRRFYVYYTNLDGNIVVARYLRSAGNRLVADPSQHLELLWPDGNRFIPHSGASNHNGGTLMFGPDNYLYIGVGDGGGGNDQFRNAQNPTTLLGKMLRIDVRVSLADAKGYTIPPDNPFLDSTPIAALGEIWAFGLRNPWKFSFDYPASGGTGGLVIADVGQSAYEEVDYEPANQGGRNYGWAYREGAHPGDTNDTPAYGPLTDPIYEYTHADGISISGGYIYRGTGLGVTYRGRYFFGDLNGRVWSIALTINQSTGEATASQLVEHTADFGGQSTLGSVVGFGVDGSSELYIVGYGKGTIFRVVSAGPAMSLDGPAPGAVVEPFSVSGWAIDRRAGSGSGVDAVHVWAFPSSGSPVFLGAASYGGGRPDVGSIYGSQFTNSAFNLQVRGLAPGAYTITAYTHSSVTGDFVDSRSAAVTVRNNPKMSNDAPRDGATVGPRFTVTGWALDAAAASGTGVDSVHVWAYPSSGASPIFLGVAGYGAARADVGGIFGAQFTNTGYALVVPNLAFGRYQLVVFAHSTVSGSFDNAAVMNISVSADTQMSIDSPLNGSTVTRPFVVGGWALDRSAATGTGVDAVHVWAFPTSGAAGQFLGAASFSARPDVASIYGSQFTNSGYTLSVNSLAAGTYDVIVYARSTVTNSFNAARVVRITVQ